jgi:hypothetical protein
MQTKNPFKNRDLTKQLLFPTLSWSSMNQFESYDKDEWYDRYVLGNRGEVNEAMKAGIDIGERLTVDPKYLPEVPRPQLYEHVINARFAKINLTGHLDGWSFAKKEILEYKTTANKKRWTKKTVDEWGQLDFYAMLVYLKHKIQPQDLHIKLIAIPVVAQKGGKVVRSKEPVQIFETNRTMVDIIAFMLRVKRVYGEMLEYVDNRIARDSKSALISK